MDTSKQFFQLHGVDAEERIVLRKKLRRKDVLAFFAQLAPTTVGIEACGASHYWARELAKLGHTVKIMAAQHVKPYLKRNKNDARDAEALCEAMSRPSMRFVAVKSAEAQAGLMLASVRDLLIRQRTQVSNAIRGHAAEFGLIAAKGLDKVELLLSRIAADESLPELARALFCALGRARAQLDARIARIDSELVRFFRSAPMSRRLAELPSIGPIAATLLPLKTPDPKSFRSGRHFAAWLGLTPKDHSTAGKQRLGAITRAGDEGLRAVLVAGAMAVIRQVKAGRRTWPWLERLLARKPAKLAAVALANKIARAAWKLMTSGEPYDPARLMRAA
jgi:transposase